MIRVTEALARVGLTDMEHVTEFGLRRGTLVHAATALDDRGDLDERSVDPVHVAPYLASWRLFRAQTGLKVLEIERAVHYEAMQYQGTFDRLVELDGAKILIDLKTGVPARWHGLQTAAYALAYTAEVGGTTPMRAGVYLNGDGKVAKMQLFKKRSDYEVWKAVVTVANFMGD